MHQNEASPVLLPSQISETTWQNLNSEQEARKNDLEKDNIFVIEKILEKKKTKGKAFYKIKWGSYEETSWEPETNIPKIFRDFYDRTGIQELPSPRIKHTKTIGNTEYHLLSWDDWSKTWAQDSEFCFKGSKENLKETFSCQTRKDKDKRLCRHTWGVLIGCFPCGVVVLFDEIFGSGCLIYIYPIFITV